MAGVTTFSAMLYIVIVNPALLAQGGMDFSGTYAATILATAGASLLMGGLADYPLAVAPGIGLNAYFVYGVILSTGHSWQEAMGAAFLASIFFLLLVWTSFFRYFLNIVPWSLKMAIAGGIGLFVTLIGMEKGKLIVGSPTTVTMLGNLAEPTAFLTLLGLLITAVLLAYRIQAAMLLGMVAVFAAALSLGFATLPAELFSWPQGLEKAAGQLTFSFQGNMPLIILVMLLMLLFNNTGTFLGIGRQAGLIKDDEMTGDRQVFQAAAWGGLLGSFLGTGLAAGYVESGTGVSAGGRTGITAMVTAGLFLLLLFCAPLAQSAANVPAVTAPALIFTGFFMISGLHGIDWQDFTEGLPAFLTMLVMPLSYDILAGVGTGFISYAILKLFSGHWRQVHPLLYFFALLFALHMGGVY